MSNTTSRLPLEQAFRIGEELIELLSPACDRIAIGGSIRREQPTIGDVELVVIPKMVECQGPIGLFMDNDPYLVNRLNELCADLVLGGLLNYRLNKDGKRAWGTDLKWGIYQDFAVDIYSATAETWGVTLAIRTGSAEFSHKLVTPRAAGGFCPFNLHFKGWRVRRRDDGTALNTPEEVDVFDALGIGCPEPWLRTDTYQPVRIAAHA